MNQPLDRRQWLRGATLGAGAAAFAAWMPAWAQPVSEGSASPGSAPALPVVTGEDIRLRIARQSVRVDGRSAHAIGINGTVPGPLIRLREGQPLRLHVENALDSWSSIHWHGLLLPSQYDGVPGVSFPGIAPHSSFLYEFPIRQAGTYWYHSHSGFQEQLGLHGPIVIDPAGTDPVGFDREHVIFLSDQSAISPDTLFRRMKRDPGGLNFQKQTLGGLLAGHDQSLAERLKWGGMRMDPTDVADATGAVYTYTVNGYGPLDNWTALFRPGERVRLRIVNGSSMTTFNVRIPGLAMMVVQADGQNVRPVETDEVQIGVAETYDVVVTPTEDRAYTLVGESVDRSGLARATLAPRAGMVAPIPPLRPRPLATMADMGMAMPDGGGGKDAMAGMADMAGGGMATGTDHGDHGGHRVSSGMAMGAMSMRDFGHAPDIRKSPGVATIAPMPRDRTGMPGQGLEHVGHRVLVYTDLVALERNPDLRAPSRSIDVHLTGNMERFMWSFDGEAMSDRMEPIPFTEGERVRVTLINDTMMAHPIHLHGHFFELVTGHGDHAPRKHSVLVAPGGRVRFDLTADAPGDWAFHCHLLYHMAAGMMRIVSVRSPQGVSA
ncbi:copper resistance system multicopper oxidase [Sphingomonas abietis]|uniref:Copper resistance system multicopper oxidase n=1 Tax=Sphingomonas abietis TaxID=3012344 RepID=A0ABY7NX82_9SPHN|nr:copper resistance system multicopper oxidase [Sphingomonas abietis]WBO24006.1 copper resistance system multicopper oxidase [Sphingomonas abietis]